MGGCIAFIYASKKSIIIDKWLKQIIINVKKFKEVLSNKANTTSWFESYKKVNAWYYLGNQIVNNLIINATSDIFLGIDRYKIQVSPHAYCIKNSSLSFRKKYLLLYYERGDPQIVLNKSKDLVFLQNSWTPLKYKEMPEEEFLKQDILLSKLLAKLLEYKV